MPGILDKVLGRTRHAIGSGGILGTGGLLGGGSGSTGILSQALGPLNGRLASIQSAGGLQAKIQALSSTLGTRLNNPTGILSGLGSAGSSTPPAPPATDIGYQVSSAGRVYGSPQPPPGIAYR